MNNKRETFIKLLEVSLSMGWNELVTYLVDQLKAGYDENTLRNQLIAQGYHSFDIDPAMDAAKNQVFGLSNYVKSYMSKGYSGQQIQDFLNDLGYNQIDIDHAFRQAGVRRQGIHIHVSPLAIFVIGMLVIIAGGVYFGIGFLKIDPAVKSTPKQLDVSITVVTSSVEPGQDLMYKVSLTNFGTFRGYDVTLIYELKDSYGELLDQIQETKYIESTLSFIKEMSIPDDMEPGRYSVVVTANYDNYSSVAKKLFSVVSSLEVVRNETVEINVTVVKNVTVPEDFTDTGAFAGLSRSEIESALKSTNDPEAAGEACAGLISENLRSSCFIMLSRITSDSTFCAKVDKSSRDSCYITVAMNSTDLSVCDEIVQDQVKSSCTALVEVNINKEKLFSRRR